MRVRVGVIAALVALTLVVGPGAHAETTTTYSAVGVLQGQGGWNYRGTLVGEMGVTTITFSLVEVPAQFLPCEPTELHGDFHIVDASGNGVSGTVLSAGPQILVGAEGPTCAAIHVSDEVGRHRFQLFITGGGTGIYAGATGSGAIDGVGLTGGPWAGTMYLAISLP